MRLVSTSYMKFLLTLLIAPLLLLQTVVSAQNGSQAGQISTPQQRNSSNDNAQDSTIQPVSLESLPTPTYSQYVDAVDGMSIDTLVSVAAQQSGQLLAARQNVEIIRGRILQAGLKPNPTIQTEYVTDRLISREGEYDFRISYAQPIELGGRRGSRVRVAELELAQAEQELAFQERQVATEIELQYAEALAASEGLRLTEQLLGLNQETFRVTEIRFNEGDVARLDVNLIRVEVNRLRAQMLQAENRVREALLQLRTLAGLEINEPVRLRTSLRDVRLSENLTLETLQAAALQNRADLQAARIAEDVAEARIARAKAEASPALTLFGSYEQEKGAEGEMLTMRSVSANKKIGVGASITLPTRNRNQGNIAEAAASRIQARHRREFLESLVVRDVRQAFNRLQTARETMSIYENELLPRSRENLRIIRTAYDLGDQGLLEVVAEQRRLVDAQQQYIGSLRDYYQAIIELERAVGTRIR